MCTWNCINVELQILWWQRHVAISIRVLSLHSRNIINKACDVTAATTGQAHASHDEATTRCHAQWNAYYPYRR